VIEEVPDNYAKNKFKVDKLLLSENQIRVLGKSSFRNFQWINYTSLEANPTTTIGKANRERQQLSLAVSFMTALLMNLHVPHCTLISIVDIMVRKPNFFNAKSHSMIKIEGRSPFQILVYVRSRL
jgi:hypothetical protein